MPDKEAIIKVDSYEHNEDGLTTEDPETVKTIYEKRLRKEKFLNQEFEHYEPVKIYGNKDSSVVNSCPVLVM